jgi:DNA-directed RNA polymerase subunit F
MSLFDDVISNTASDRPPFRQAPEDDYLVTVRSAKKVTANSGTQGIELVFTMSENLSNAGDMEGVDLAKCRLKDTLWVTEKTKEFVARDLARIAPETVGKTFTDALDILPGAEAVVRVKHQTHSRTGEELRTPYLEVSSYYTRDWYFANKMGAAA